MLTMIKPALQTGQCEEEQPGRLPVRVRDQRVCEWLIPCLKAMDVVPGDFPRGSLLSHNRETWDRAVLPPPLTLQGATGFPFPVCHCFQVRAAGRGRYPCDIGLQPVPMNLP